MNARCEAVGKYVLPVFRSLVAKELVATHNMTQMEVAQILGTTQAAISQYINSKRAFKGVQQFGEAQKKIERVAKKTAAQLAERQITWATVTLNVCKLCSEFSCENANQVPVPFAEDYAI